MMMRRFIDVVFVQPKQRYYVVLRQGKFWQLPRLNLSHSAWLLKKPYEGSLAEIFVSKQQNVAGRTFAINPQNCRLPEGLHGANAYRFLDWWNQYDHQWLKAAAGDPACKVAASKAAQNADNQSAPKSETAPIVDRSAAAPGKADVFDDLLNALNEEILHNAH